MNIDDFSIEQRENIVKTLDGAFAFVPPALPPEIELNAIAMALSSASHAIGELNGAARRLQNPFMLVHPLTRKEALTSSAMEGTITTIGNIVLEEADASSGEDDNAREAFNYAFALRKANEQLITLPMSHRVIKEAHRNLLSGLSTKRGAGKRPGEYKMHQNAIGQLGQSIQSARYVPPPPQQTLDCMDRLEQFLNIENLRHGEKILHLALLHYQFEAIHPFDDGNGRIGRMLVTLMAQQMKLVDLPLLHISSFLEKRKDEYIERLFEVSARANWNDWINFFLLTIEQSCNQATKMVDRLITLQSEMKLQVLKTKNNHRLTTIIDNLFQSGWTTIGKNQTLCSVSFPTAQSDLKTLVELGLLTEVLDRRPIIFYAPKIIELSERE